MNDARSLQQRIGELYADLALPLIGIFVGAAVLLGLWLG